MYKTAPACPSCKFADKQDVFIMAGVVRTKGDPGSDSRQGCIRKAMNEMWLES